MRRQNMPQQQLPPTSMQKNNQYGQYGGQQQKGQYNEQDYYDEDDQYAQYEDQEGGEEDDEEEYEFENEEEYQAYIQMREQQLEQQGIHLVEQDQDFEPTEEEILDYAQFLGMNLDEDQEFFYIAREGLVAPLPNGWCYAQVDGEEATYFYCRLTQQMYEENPNDEVFRNKFIDEKRMKEIKKQRENPPAATSKKRSKLQNIIDQYSTNLDEQQSSNNDVKKDQSNKGKSDTNVNISNLDPSVLQSNKQSLTQNQNEGTSLSNLGQVTQKNLISKQGSIAESQSNNTKSSNLGSFTNAKTVNPKNKLNALEPLNEKFSKELSQPQIDQKNKLKEKDNSEYEFDEDEHAFLQSDDEEDEDGKSRQSSNLPKGKSSLMESKNSNSRPPSASKNKEIQKPSTIIGQKKVQSEIMKEDKSYKDISKQKKSKSGVDELEEVDLEEIQNQEESKGLNPLKLSNIKSDKKPPSLSPLEKKPSTTTQNKIQELSPKSKNQLEDKKKKSQEDIMQSSLQDKLMNTSDKKNSNHNIDQISYTFGSKLQDGNQNLSDTKMRDSNIKSKEKYANSQENVRLSQETDSQIKDDFDKNFTTSGDKYSSLESQRKNQSSKINEQNQTKEFDDETGNYTYSKEGSISQDQIQNIDSFSNQPFQQDQSQPYQQVEISPNQIKQSLVLDKKLIKIEENDQDSEQSPQNIRRDYNVEYQNQQYQNQQVQDEQYEINRYDLDFEEQIIIQQYIEEKENEMQQRQARQEQQITQQLFAYNKLIKGEINGNYDSVYQARINVDQLQTQEKNKIRNKLLKEFQQLEEQEVKRNQIQFEDAVKIYKEEKLFDNEQKVNELNILLKDKFYKKLEQHEKIVKNLKSIISKNDLIYSQHRKVSQQKFNQTYSTILQQQCQQKYEHEKAELEKEFEMLKSKTIFDFETEFERTQQLEADEIQKQKINKTSKMLDLKEIYIKKYYLEKQERESEMNMNAQNMYKREVEYIDDNFLSRYQQELSQAIFKKTKQYEQQIQFTNEFNQQKLDEFMKLTQKENDHKIKLLEIEHSRRLSQIEEQLREQKGLKNNYKYIQDRQIQTDSDVRLKIVELKNLISLKKQNLQIFKNERKQNILNKDQILFESNIIRNSKNLTGFLTQILENRVQSTIHLKERQKQIKEEMNLIKQESKKQQNSTPQPINENNNDNNNMTEIQQILQNYAHSSEKLYTNKKRSKLWLEQIKHENSLIDQQKQKLKYEKIYLKTVYQDIQTEKQKQKKQIDSIKKEPNMNEEERLYKITNIQQSNSKLVEQFNEDVKSIRRNEELMRRRDEQLLQVEKSFNKTMNLGLDEENLIEAYSKFKSLTNQPLKLLKLVPNDDIEVKMKINNNQQDLSSYLDITDVDQTPEQQQLEMHQRFQYADADVDKKPHQLKEIYHGLETPIIKGMVQQREEYNQPNIDRVDTLLKNAKYSQQMMTAKYSGYLLRNKQIKASENNNKIQSEVSQHSQWFRDVKSYINQSLFDRTTAHSKLKTII